MKHELKNALILTVFTAFSALSQEAAKPHDSPDKEKTTSSASEKNRIEGQAFLATNAKAEGVIVLPDGLQYRVLKTGSGDTPKTNDLVFIKYRGTFVDGKEFDHHNHFLTRLDGGIKGWQEALRQMKVGSKLQVFVPPALAFGDEGEPVHHIAPDSTLIYELELTSIAPPNPQFGRALGHAFDEDVSTPTSTK
jgi:FKBP-type peptidyl-prolyl cis-trans isomerase